MSTCTSAACAVSATDISLACHVHCGGGASSEGGAMGAGHPGSLIAYWYGCLGGNGSYGLTAVTDGNSGVALRTAIPKHLCCFDCGDQGSVTEVGSCYFPDDLWFNEAHITSCEYGVFCNFTTDITNKTVYVEGLYYGRGHGNYTLQHEHQHSVKGYMKEGVGFCSYPVCANCCAMNFDSFQTIDFTSRWPADCIDGPVRTHIEHGAEFNRVCRQGSCSHSHAGRLTRMIKYQNCIFVHNHHFRELYVYTV